MHTHLVLLPVSVPSFTPSWPMVSSVGEVTHSGDSWFVFTAWRAVCARCKYCLNNLSRWIPLGSAFPRVTFEPERQDIGCCWLSAVRYKIPRSRRCCRVNSGFVAIISEYFSIKWRLYRNTYTSW